MKKNKQNGYTLIELLAVIIILVVVGGIITSILTAVLRSGNKSTTMENVRRNGDSAMAQMSRMITYAQNFEGISVNDPSNLAPGQLQTNCVPQVGSSLIPTPIPTPTQYRYLVIKSWDDGITTFVCNDNDYTIASISSTEVVDTTHPNQSCPAQDCTYLMDTSIKTDCYFTCTQESAAAPVKIDIVLDATSSGVFSENQAAMHFETSIVIRNSGTY
jgi:prepilin-type N-terminal cleavage/methylation domain-containing protein